MKKPRYTLAQHQQLGAILAQIRRTLAAESIKLSNAYPFKEQAPNALQAAVDSLDKARSLLDDLVCGENPSADHHAVVRAYYPPKDTQLPARA